MKRQNMFLFINLWDFEIGLNTSLPFHTIMWPFFHRISQRQPLVEQEVLTLLQHLSSSSVLVGLVLLGPQFSVQYFVDRCSWCWCYSIFSFICYVLQIVVCPFVCFLLAIVFSVLFRYTDSDYLFGTYKLFLFISTS